MKTFKAFMNEETMPFANVKSGEIGLDNVAVKDQINQLLTGITSGKFVTPYIALERVNKTLANFHIFLPTQNFLEGDSGMAYWPIHQFGIKAGMNSISQYVTNGEVGKDYTHGPHIEGEANDLVSKPESFDYFLYFEYRMSDCGMFKIFCEVVDQYDLDEILDDVEAELSGDVEDSDLNEESMDEACWKGYRKEGMKTMFGKRYPNCVKVEK